MNDIICTLLGHSINRMRVWHDCLDFRTTCLRCGRPLLRDGYRSWRLFDSGTDLRPDSLPREPHPKFQRY